MFARRGLFALPALLIPSRPRAEEDAEADRRPRALATPRQVRLRPGAPPVDLRAQVMPAQHDGSRQELALRFSGPGAPEAEFRFPTWYGYARAFAVREMRGRDLVFAAFEGSTGTGTYQEIQAVLGQEDDGVARILALETLHYRMLGPCGGGTWLAIRATPLADGSALRLDHAWRRREADCPPPRGGPGRRMVAWNTVLAWSGRGPMRAPAPLARTFRARRLVEASRTKTMTWLAEMPRSRVTQADLDRLGLMETIETI